MKTWLLLVTLLSSLLIYSQSYSKFGIENADENLPMGLKVGDLAPDFQLLDSKGGNHSLSESLKSGPVVLIFYRGQWCPVCSRYLSAVQDSLNLILSEGAILMAVTPETAENADKLEQEVKSTFPVLIDADEIVMKDYDVLFNVTSAYQTKIKVALFTSIAANNDKEEARLPVPATFVINQEGRIIYRQFDFNYKSRASVKDMLGALKTMK